MAQEAQSNRNSVNSQLMVRLVSTQWTLDNTNELIDYFLECMGKSKRN